MKKVIITGGAGFLGSILSTILIRKDYEVVSLDIRESKVSGVKSVIANITEPLEGNSLLEHPYAVINLAGKRIFGKWNEKFKDLIYTTRIDGTKNLVTFFSEEKYKPAVFISASAVGIYGDQGNNEISETSPHGDTFLSKVAHDWEEEAKRVQTFGVRLIIFRHAHILGEGGLLGVLKPFYKFGIGGPLGNGHQWFPWIHIDDVVSLYVWALETESVKGIYNAAAPEPIRNKTFSKTVARVLHRPHIFFIPRFALRLLYGEFADEMLVSQKVISSRLPLNKDIIKYSTIDLALKNLLK